MALLRELLATFSLQVDDSQVKKADKTLGGFKNAIRSAGAAIGVFFVARGLTKMASETIEAGDRLDELSQKVGINTTSLQEWEFAAKKAGVGGETVSAALGKLAKSASAAQGGSEEMVKAFSSLGVTVTDSQGNLKNLDTLMLEISDGMAGVDNETQRAALSMKIFGGAGTDLIPLLSSGSAEIDKQRQKLHELGGVMDDVLIKQSVEAADNIDDFHASLTGIRNVLVLQILPVFNRGLTVLTKWVAGLRKSEQAAAVLKTVLIGLGAVAAGIGLKLLVAFGPLLLKFTLIAIAIGGVILLVQSFVRLLRGQESVVGKWITDLDKTLERLEKIVPLIKILRSIGIATGEAAANVALGTSAEARELEFQQTVGPLSRVGRNTAAFAESVREPADGEKPWWLQRRNAVAPGPAGAATVQRAARVVAPVTNNVTSTVNVTANGTDPKGVVDLIKREGKAQIDAMLKNAAAAQPGTP